MSETTSKPLCGFIYNRQRTDGVYRYGVYVFDRWNVPGGERLSYTAKELRKQLSDGHFEGGNFDFDKGKLNINNRSMSVLDTEMPSVLGHILNEKRTNYYFGFFLIGIDGILLKLTGAEMANIAYDALRNRIRYPFKNMQVGRMHKASETPMFSGTYKKKGFVFVYED